MSRTDAAAWVLSICIGCLRRSQAKTLATLVAAALVVPRLTLAGPGRQVAGPVDYIIRIKSKVTVKFSGQNVRLDRYPAQRGACELHKNVLYRQCDPVKQLVVNATPPANACFSNCSHTSADRGVTGDESGARGEDQPRGALVVRGVMCS
jgi:hypothetical protein